MELNQRAYKTWKAITIILFIAAGVVFLVSIPSYQGVIQFLGRFQPDRSFDSLSFQTFTLLQWLVRGKALILAVGGIIFLLNRERSSRWIENLGNKISVISIRSDIRSILESTFPREDRWIFIALGVVTLLGLMIRLIQIERTVDYDEAYTFIHFSSRSLRYIVTDYSAPNNHVFHSLLVYFAYHIFGNHIWALRLPALLAGILTIPAVYMAGKILYGRNAGLLAAALVACTPILVDYSNNARGYTLMCLFAAFILWLAAILRERSSFTGWLLLAIVSAFGFYTLPVMVYPVSAVFLWLLLSWVFKSIGSNPPRKFIIEFIITSILTIILTIDLYSPILFFGTGLSSITSNDFVLSQGWMDFLQSLQSRIPRVWEEWNRMVPNSLSILSGIGFLLLIILEWRNFKHKIPVWIAAMVAITVLIFAQRVTPWPRVWLFLLVFYLLWAAAGWTALFRIIFSRITGKILQPMFMGVVVLATLVGYLAYRSDPTFISPEKYITKDIANYVSDHLTDDDTIVAVSPFTIEVGYYLTQYGIPFDRFYDRDRKEGIKHAIVIVADRSKFPTLQSVIDFQRLQNILDIDQAQLIYQHKRILVYSVPVLN